METTNHKPTPGSDPEWEAAQKRIPGIAETIIPKEEEKAPEPKPEATPEAVTPPEEKKPEVKKPDEPVAGDPPPTRTRPEKYIPVQQYTDEKRTWHESEAQYKSRIAELEKLAGKAESAQSDDKIRVYAEKHGVTFEEAKDQVESLRDILGVTAQKPTEVKPAEFSPEQKASLARAEEAEARQVFDTEYNERAIPALKRLFPNATDSQILAAKKRVEEIACTTPFLKSPLRTVVIESEESLADLFKSKPGSPEAQRRGADKNPVEFSASDFVDGKTSFKELENVTQDQLNNIVKGMDGKTYESYMRFVNANDKIIINRGGRKVEI